MWQDNMTLRLTRIISKENDSNFPNESSEAKFKAVPGSGSYAAAESAGVLPSFAWISVLRYSRSLMLA